jgi:hypothetical protein
MDVREYRKRYEADLAASTTAAKTARPAGATEAGNEVPALLATLRNAQETPAARLAALRRLKAARFLVERFAPYNADFLAALREIIRPGTDHKLCEAALEDLAIERDPQAEEVLRRGLSDAKAALVSPAKALQFLSYDDHAGIIPLARDIFHRATDTGTKEEALRVLASDPQSADLFANLLKDKSQPRSIRALSATGLHLVNPNAFVDAARSILNDNKDYDDIRATVIGTLAHVADAAHTPKDEGFVNHLRNLAESGSANVRSAVGRFMEKLQQ